MTARVAATLLLLASSVLFAQTPSANPPKMTSKPQSPEAVHRSALVIDTHADTPQRFLDEHFDLADPRGKGDLNLDSIHKGNLGAEFFSIWVEPKLYKGQYARRTLELIDSVKLQVARHPDQIQFVATPEGIEEAHRNHKFAALMGIEGGHSIENSLALLRQYYALGVRYMTLTWSNSNDWADSSGDIDDTSIPHTKEGLTEFGKDVVYEMNRLGMMVDISHVSDATFYRTLRISRAPVIASHSDARALCNAPRNMTDDMIRAVATYGGGPNSEGGVVQVNFFAGFVSQAYWDAMKALQPEIAKAIADAKDKAKAEGREFKYADEDTITRSYMERIPRPPLSMLIDHIDHIAKVAGVDHVGIGSDFDGVSGQLPEGLDSPADLPKITSALMARGYSAEDCRKILGGNLLRVFREVEAVSKELQAEDRPKITDKQPFDKPAK
jgi:membrane dipeptidase